MTASMPSMIAGVDRHSSQQVDHIDAVFRSRCDYSRSICFCQVSRSLSARSRERDVQLLTQALAGRARACGADVHLVSGHLPQQSRGHLGPSGILHAHEQDLRRSSQVAAAGHCQCA
jgi:hypothetical protein